MEKSIQRNSSITEGNIFKQLMIFFFPILLGSLFQQLYNTADAVILGRFVGKEALAAVGGTTGSIINLFVGFFVGIASGCAVIIAQHSGAKDDRQISDAVHTAVAFAFICGFFISILGFVTSKTMLILINVPADILPASTTYLQFYFLGMTANLVYNMGAAILRALGDSKTPLKFLIISCFTNIVLDILFVLVFRLSVLGTALATVISQIISACLVLYKLSKASDSSKLFFNKIRIHTYQLSRMIYIGLAAGLQSATFTLANIVLQSSVNLLGTDSIAAYSAFSKLDPIYWMSMQALGISITTVVSQNYGARKKDRVKATIQIGTVTALLMTIFIAIFLRLTSPYLYRIFTDDANVILIGTSTLFFMANSYILYFLIEIFSSSLRAVGDSWIPMLITTFGICTVRVFWLLVVFPKNMTMQNVLMVYPLSWGITSILFSIYVFKFSKLRKWLKGA